jgi:glycosyltransferase involved in cell wall biosynthesis
LYNRSATGLGSGGRPVIAMSIRVLHVTSGLDLGSGGPAVALAGLVEGQQSAGIDVRVVASYRPEREPQLDEPMRRKGVAVTCVGPCRGRFARHPDLAAAVAAGVESADIVHIHALFEDVQHLAATCALQRGKPYVIRPCGMLDRWSLRRRWLAKKLYMTWRLSSMLRAAAAIHYTTRFEQLGASPLRLERPSIVEPNGVNIVDYEHLPAAGVFRKRFNVPGHSPLVAFLGRVHPGKGVDHLVRAIATAQLSNVTLAIIGPDSGGYLETIRSLANRCGVADRVLFTGLLKGQDRIAGLVDAAVFAMPSEHENFGIAVAEAMATGTPVIVSPEVGIADDVTAAGAGAVVPLHYKPLSAEIARWLTDPVLRAEAGERGRAYAFARYDWNQIGRRWGGHYAELLSVARSA